MFLRARRSIAAAIGVALAAVPASQAFSQVPAAPSAAPAGDVTRATLDNGLRVIIVRDPLAPVVTVYDNYLVGADETPPGFPGMAHAQEHMAFRGCDGVNADQTSAIFAQLGGDGDADTQQTITQYFETVPAADLDVALHLDAACMKGITDSEEQWKQERGAIEQEVAQDLSNPVYKAFVRIDEDVFAGTPYAHDALGTRESFDKTTGALLEKFYRTWYAPNNAVLVISGDVDARATLNLVNQLYAPIPRREIGTRPTVDIKPVKADSFTLDSDLPVPLAVVGYRLPGSDDPDFAAANVLVDVLASKRGDLYGLVPQGKALDASMQIASPFPKATLALAYTELAPNADTKASIADIRSIVNRYLKDGFPADLVEAAKTAEVAQDQFNRNSIGDLAGAWSEAVAAEGRSSPDDDVDAIRKVTVDDVNRVARQYLLDNASVDVVLAPRPSGNPVASKGFGGGETTTSAPTKPVVLPDWASAKLANVQVPNATLSPNDQRLPNGVRLIVQPETTSDTVTVVGEIAHQDALQAPPGKEGVGQVLGSLFSYGTTTLDRLAFQKALDDIGAQLDAGTSFSLHVLKSKFDRGVELLAGDELHPGLPASAFAVVQTQVEAGLQGEMQSPAFLAQRAIGKATLPPGDPGLREATPKTVAALSLDDVKAYHGQLFRPDVTTIVVIGNVTVDEARSTILKYFGDWKADGPRPALDLPPVPLNKPAAAVVPDRSRVQDEATLVENVALTRKNPDYYAFELGDHVLGGGFYATRLYHDLRQVAGLVYSVENRLNAGKTRSTYVVSYACDPPNVSKARLLAERDLHAMQTRDVTAAELQQAKAILLRQLPLRDASEDAVAAAFARYSLAELPLDEAHRAALIYAKLTAADIRAAFKKYVRTSSFVQVVTGPNPS